MHMLRQWCSMSMLHRTCEYIHVGVRFGGLSLPNGWCFLHIPISFEPWGVKKYSVPYMMQIELACISIKCGIVNPYIDGLIVLAMS